MVEYSSDPLDRTFSALADPTRRALLARLMAAESLSVSDLAKPLAMSLPAVMKHLDVLGDAGLVTRSKSGRTVSCRLNAAPMEAAMHWLARYERFWTVQLDRLAAFLENDSCPTPQPSSPSQASRSSAASPQRPRRSTPPGPTPKK
jgi:DNA-binding transcriptional ArsR family regulator